MFFSLQKSGLKRNFKDTFIKSLFVVLIEIRFSIKQCLPPSAAYIAVKTVFAEKCHENMCVCQYICFYGQNFCMSHK